MTDNNMKNTEILQKKLNNYSDMLFKIAYIRLQNVQDAEDVVQEVFYQYIRHGDKFNSDEHEKAWMIKVTLNACRKVWRSAWNRHRDDFGADIEAYCQNTMVNLKSLEEDALTVEENRIILAAVKELPIIYRDVIHLFYYEELSIREIGEATGRKESTVTSRLTRGRELLRKKLKEEYDFA